jgi:putative SOS response-associated peptidase YedK
MCGRFVAATDPDGLVRFFSVDERKADDVAASWNVAPTETVHAVAEHEDRRVLVALRWGLVPAWAEDAKIGSRLINARAETLAEKPAFRDAFRRKRCLVPADGFYEWHTRPDGVKVPYYIHRRDGAPLAFAGLWSAWRDRSNPGSEWLRTCTIVTTNAGSRMRELHHRMPALLPHEAWDAWLDPDLSDPDALRALLDTASDEPLAWHPVSTRVNSPRVDEPGLIAPVPEPPSAPERHS